MITDDAVERVREWLGVRMRRPHTAWPAPDGNMLVAIREKLATEQLVTGTGIVELEYDRDDGWALLCPRVKPISAPTPIEAAILGVDAMLRDEP
jgi:hypothetical protein